MAITVDSSNQYDSGVTTDTTSTWSHTIGSGSERILIVDIPESRSVSIVSVTYGGVALTLGVGFINGEDSGRIYYLVNPTIGTANVIVTYSVSLTYRTTGSVSFFGVDQTSPIGTTITQEGTSLGFTVPITTAFANSYILECFSTTGATMTPTAGQTDYHNAANRHGAYDASTIIGIYNQSWSGDLELHYTYVSMEVKAFGATGTNTQINIGDVWKTVAGMQINIGDVWKPVVSAKINIGDVWKNIF